MRLRRLDLTRYGRFTDHAIDFGAAEAGMPDLHLVYGPNEAGKSTALSAFLDLLYGIEERSPYDFVHAYDVMRIGAALELPGGPQTFVRVKKRQASLRDDADQPVGDGLLLDALGGMGRDAYRSMFSLDDDTLEKGGEDILRSQGELGQLLFAASAGLAEMSRRLEAVRDEADSFYRPRARGGTLRELKDARDAARAQREALDTQASAHARLVAERDAAVARSDEAMAARRQTQLRMEEVRRQLVALPRLAARRDLRDRLAGLAEVPAAPSGWREALPALLQEATELRVRAGHADAELVAGAAKLAGIEVDEAALGVAPRLDELGRRKARYLTADGDLPNRRQELREAEMAVHGLLERLGHDGTTAPERLLLPVATVGRLRTLIERQSGVDAAVGLAQIELTQAQQRLAAASDALAAEAGGASAVDRSAAVASLGRLMAELRDSDAGVRLRHAAREAQRHRAALADQLASLAPWRGDDRDLAALHVPRVATLEAWQREFDAAQDQADRLVAEVERTEAERGRLDAEMAVMMEATGVVGDREAAATRAAREAAWAAHRQALDQGSADAFEAALRRDDLAAETRFRHGQDVARLQQARERRAGHDAELARLRTLLRTARDRRAAVDAAVAAALAALGNPLPADADPLAALPAWLAMRDRALESAALLAAAERDGAEARADVDAARANLAAAMRNAEIAHDPAATLDQLLQAAQVAIDAEAARATRREEVAQRRRDVAQREQALAATQAAREEWSAHWRETCTGCWLAVDGQVPGTAEVGGVLDLLARLDPALEKVAGLRDRVEKMEADQASFAALAAEIPGTLGLPTDGVAPLDLGRQVERRCRAAQDAVVARQAAEDEIADARRRKADLGKAQALHDARASEMMRHFAVDSLETVDRSLQVGARRDELQMQIEGAERDIVEAMGAPSLAEAETALGAADRAELDAELANLEPAFEQQDAQLREAHAEQRRVEAALDAIGGDDAVARLDTQRRTILLDIEDRARRYLRLRAGIAAAGMALRAYRDTHRSGMMERASAAFRTISRGAYRGLTTQAEKDTEVLIAQMADGGSKLVSALSKGTRFQLYLALRVAGYHEFARTRRPVPFIADDIMETFDDFRAEEAFRLFAEMAEVGQVIYLTHHRHLCDIARQICPGVRVHEIAPSYRQ